MRLGSIIPLYTLNRHSDAQICIKCLEKFQKHFPKWWFFHGDLPRVESVKLKQPSCWRMRFGILHPGLEPHFTKPDDWSIDHLQRRFPCNTFRPDVWCHYTRAYHWVHLNGYFMVLFQWQQTYSMTISVGTRIKLMLMMLHGSTCNYQSNQKILVVHWGLLLVVCWQSPTAAWSKRFVDLMTNDINWHALSKTSKGEELHPRKATWHWKITSYWYVMVGVPLPC